MFRLLRRVYEYDEYNDKTFHSLERNKRFEEEVGEVYDVFEIDKDHPNGSELHIIYDNAIIDIYNFASKKLITRLFARPGQIRRYGIDDEDILAIALDNQVKGKNHW